MKKWLKNMGSVAGGFIIQMTALFVARHGWTLFSSFWFIWGGLVGSWLFKWSFKTDVDKVAKTVTTEGGVYRDGVAGLHEQMAALKRENDELQKKRGVDWFVVFLSAMGGIVLLLVIAAVAQTAHDHFVVLHDGGASVCSDAGAGAD